MIECSMPNRYKAVHYLLLSISVLLFSIKLFKSEFQTILKDNNLSMEEVKSILWRKEYWQ